jgi:hypothetical protein
MDDVFGYDNFRNEICWKYDKWSNVSNCFQRNHDVILFYSFKGAVFNELRELIETKRKRNLVEIVDGKKVVTPTLVKLGVVGVSSTQILEGVQVGDEIEVGPRNK